MLERQAVGSQGHGAACIAWLAPGAKAPYAKCRACLSRRAVRQDRGRLMKFSIVTPSFRQSQWLRLCVASVADQEGVEAEHIVQDSCSDDGTQAWLPHDPRVRAFIEKDSGMYDAINRGFDRATGDVLAYLNCDEQYLPGALRSVADYFAAHPGIDVCAADFVVTDAGGAYRCSRFALTPSLPSMWVRFGVATCSMFVRRRVVDEVGMRFDTRWRALGDLFWVAEACERGVRFGELRRFTSVFAETGANLGLNPAVLSEREAYVRRTPRWVRAAAPLFIGWHRWRMLVRGAFTQRAFAYSLYTIQSPERRVTIEVPRPSAIWRR